MEHSEAASNLQMIHKGSDPSSQIEYCRSVVMIPQSVTPGKVADGLAGAPRLAK